MKGQVRSLDVIVTSDCNLTCAYCYQNARTRTSIRWSTLRPALDALLESRHPRVTLNFIGGEPLLEFPLIRRAVRYVEARHANAPDVDLSIATNGTLMGPAEADFLAGHDFGVQLSFDGVPGAQRLRGRSTYPLLDRLLVRLRADFPLWFGRRVGIAAVLGTRTLPYLADSVDYFLARGVRDIAIAPALTNQPDWGAQHLQALKEQFARVARSCAQVYRRTGHVPVRLLRPRTSTPREPGAWLCGIASGESLALDVNGECTGCVLLARSYQRFPDTALGRSLSGARLDGVAAAVRRHSRGTYRESLRETGLFSDWDRKGSSRRRCARCAVRDECVICPVCIVHQPGNGDPHRIPDFVCAFNRVAIAQRRRFPSLCGDPAVADGDRPMPVRRRANAGPPLAGANRTALHSYLPPSAR